MALERVLLIYEEEEGRRDGHLADSVMALQRLLLVREEAAPIGLRVRTCEKLKMKMKRRRRRNR